MWIPASTPSPLVRFKILLNPASHRTNGRDRPTMTSLEPKSKVLVIGALEHLGKYIAIASVKLGHPTLVLLPSFRSADPAQNEIIESFKKQGVTLFKGDIYNHSRLVQAIHAVDVVISATGGDLIIRTIAAIKEAGNISRFIPLGLRIDVDRTHALQPTEMILQSCRETRRFVEQSGVPYTYVVANFFAGKCFGGSNSQQSWLSLPLKLPLCGNGNTKEARHKEKGTLALLHSAFIRGDQTNFRIDPSFGVEASQLYPDIDYTTMDEYLNRFLLH